MTDGSSPIPDLAEIEALLEEVSLEYPVKLGNGSLGSETRIGKYRVTNLLGYGGQAVCFRAFDDELQRPVVIKLYRDGMSERQLKQTLEEGRSLARVSCPNVAKCFGVESFRGRPFLVLEYVDGTALDELVANKELSDHETGKILKCIVNGLRSVHSRNLLHLDLKPSNVIVQDNGEATLIDFGLSRELSSEEDIALCGSPGYIAPERLAGGEVNESVDIYGVGGVLYFMLTGSEPFVGRTKVDVIEHVMTGYPDWKHPKFDSGCKRLVNTCKRCLSRSPHERFSSMHELGNSLELPARRWMNVILLAGFALSCLVLLLFWLVDPLKLQDQSRHAKNESEIPGELVSWLDDLSSDSLFENDFEVGYSWGPTQRDSAVADSSGDPVQWDSNSSIDDRLDLKAKRLYSLKITPSKTCSIAVYSLEFGEDSSVVNNIVLIGPRVNRIVKAGESIVQKVRATTLTPENKQEFLCVIATTIEFDPLEVAEVLKSRLSQPAGQSLALFQDDQLRMRGMEGVETEEALVSGSIVPYVTK